MIFTHRDSGYEVFGKISDSIFHHYDEAIVSIHEWNLWGKKSQYIPQQVVQNIYYLTERMPVTVVVFGNIYLLKNLPSVPCLVMAYEDQEAFQRAAADVIYGQLPSAGKLPATAGKGYYIHTGVETEARRNILAESAPPENGFNADFSSQLDQLLSETEKSGAAPGGELLVLKMAKQFTTRHGDTKSTEASR